MTNTALRAESQSADNTHMVFADEEHEKFYYEKLEQARCQDCYHKAMIYVLGISEDTRNHFSQIYDIKAGCIKTKCLREGWQTSGSVRVVRLAFNLYTDSVPSVDDYRRKDEQVNECREYSISDIFCCSYARYFWEGIKLRHPEYCCRQKSLDEIFAEMGGTSPPYRRQGATKKYTACIPKRREVIPGADIHIQRLQRRILTEISIHPIHLLREGKRDMMRRLTAWSLSGKILNMSTI